MAVPLVVICELSGRHFPEVEAEVWRQHPGYHLHVDQPWPQDTYARYLTEEWTIPGDLVVIEGDVLPAPRSIQALLDCPRDWCLHRLWLADHYADITLGLCKFSAHLKRAMPWLPGRSWFGQDGTRPVTHWKGIDIALAYELVKNGVQPHFHEPPPVHLRYANDPRAVVAST